jgi:hypothetical protein
MTPNRSEGLTGCAAECVCLCMHLGLPCAAVHRGVRHPLGKTKVDHCDFKVLSVLKVITDRSVSSVAQQMRLLNTAGDIVKM